MKRLLLFFLFALLVTGCRRLGTPLAINPNSTVYYSGSVTEKQADSLGRYLLQQGYFTEAENRAVQLQTRPDGFVVRFLIPERPYRDDPENTVLTFGVWKEWIAETVFPHRLVNVELADEKGEWLQTVTTFAEDHTESSSAADSLFKNTPD